jgi:hypothetical protein
MLCPIFSRPLQAMLAGHELGRLRDPRFVFPALREKNFEIRLAAVACLAFLWSDEGNKRLRRVAVNDEDAGVRQSALWAYCFAGGKSAREMLSERAKNDRDAIVRAFARGLLETELGSYSYWAV